MSREEEIMREIAEAECDLVYANEKVVEIENYLIELRKELQECGNEL